MRRFRFLGNSNNYSWEILPTTGCIYTIDEINSMRGDVPVLERHVEMWDFWEEVPEEPTKPLHKDTDLGYFAGLAMQGYIANIFDVDDMHRHSEETIVKWSIQYAKELIKQLDEQSK